MNTTKGKETCPECQSSAKINKAGVNLAVRNAGNAVPVAAPSPQCAVVDRRDKSTLQMLVAALPAVSVYYSDGLPTHQQLR